jgi:hypothetical protein
MCTHGVNELQVQPFFDEQVCYDMPMPGAPPGATQDDCFGHTLGGYMPLSGEVPGSTPGAYANSTFSRTVVDAATGDTLDEWVWVMEPAPKNGTMKGLEARRRRRRARDARRPVAQEVVPHGAAVRLGERRGEAGHVGWRRRQADALPVVAVERQRRRRRRGGPRAQQRVALAAAQHLGGKWRAAAALAAPRAEVLERRAPVRERALAAGARPGKRARPAAFRRLARGTRKRTLVARERDPEREARRLPRRLLHFPDSAHAHHAVERRRRRVSDLVVSRVA